MTKATYLIVLIGCGLYWALHVPLPSECDYPITMRLILSIAEGIKNAVTYVVTKYKYNWITQHVTCTQAAINFAFGGRISDVFSFQDRNHPDVAPGLTLSYDEFGGVKVAIYRTTGRKHLGLHLTNAVVSELVVTKKKSKAAPSRYSCNISSHTGSLIYTTKKPTKIILVHHYVVLCPVY